MSIDWWMDKQKVVYYRMELFSHKKEQSTLRVQTLPHDEPCKYQVSDRRQTQKAMYWMTPCI